jgi:hypothetical protein
MKRSLYILLCMISVLFIVTSCSKDAGQGGNSSIFGKVYVKDYNSTFTVLQSEYYGGELDVYIIYGDEKSYGDRTRTNYDGTYEFKYLRPGKYHIYAYSRDSTLQTTSLLPIIKDVEITKRKQTVEVPEITILN